MIKYVKKLSTSNTGIIKNVQTDSNRQIKKKKNKKRKEIFRNYTFEVDSSWKTLDGLFDKKVRFFTNDVMKLYFVIR